MVTFELQKKGCTLSDCRWALDGLIQAVTVGKSDSESSFYQASWASAILIRTRLLSKTPNLSLNYKNVTRRGVCDDGRRKTVCKKLKIVECYSSAALSSGPDSSRLSMTDRLKRKKQNSMRFKIATLIVGLYLGRLLK